MTDEISLLLNQLVELLKNYSAIYRGSYLPSRTSQLQAEPGSKILRESVAEHSGNLPIVASFLHPFLHSKVDLGRVLIMLSIHDIGEVKVGDVLTVRDTKTENHKHAETSAALSLLHPSLHDCYTEFETGETSEARFARAVDKITPNLYELIIDVHVASLRHAHFGFDIVQAVQKDLPLMHWDPFLLDFYSELIKRIQEHFRQ